MRLVITMGIRQLPSHPRPLQDLYRDHLEEAVLAEELGFDNVWASEHHFAEDAWNPSPITFLAAVAARTQRVRIGTYVAAAAVAQPGAGRRGHRGSRQHLGRPGRSAGRRRLGRGGVP